MKIKRILTWSYAAQQPADHPRGVIDHRDDPRVVEPGRADDAEHADDVAGAVAIGRDDGRRAGQREQLVLRADEDAHAIGALGAAEQIDDAALGLQVVEQQPHPLEIVHRVQVFEQIGLAAHDQLPLVGIAAGPAREPGRDDLLRQLIEFGLRLASPRCSSSARASASVLPRMRALRKFDGLDQRRRRQPGGNVSTRFSTWPSSATSTTSARSGSSRTNSMCLSRTLDLRGQHDAGRARQPGQHRVRLRSAPLRPIAARRRRRPAPRSTAAPLR